MRVRLIVTLFTLLALIAAACGGDDSGGGAEPGPAEDGDESPAEGDADDADLNGRESEVAADSDFRAELIASFGDGDNAATTATFAVATSAEQVTVTEATPGVELTLYAAEGIVEEAEADEIGNYLFRLVEPAREYVVLEGGTDTVAVSDYVTVPSLDDHPDQAFYDGQEISAGFGYIEMRDGTMLGANVSLPGPIEDGPYPTVIEYSGYDPSNAYGAGGRNTGPVYSQLGLAVVGVNVRGTGCSGGAFDLFEELQAIDGYDVVEAVAAQDWVYNNHVGMVGLSYSGITQLFVAATQPPNLAAITPLSVIEDSYRSTGFPGGIFNNGFAKNWADSRQADSVADADAWVTRRIDEDGDTICDTNQLLRTQNSDLSAGTELLTYYTEEADYLSPRTLVDQIQVPVFLAGAFQDEQTGGRFSTMIDNFTGTDVLKVHLYNGAHNDGLGPETLLRVMEFLDVYVAERAPMLNPVARLGAAGLYEQAFGVAGLNPPPDRFTSLAEAREVIENEPPIRMLLEMGGNEAALGGPMSRGEVLFDSWPPPAAVTTKWSLGTEMSAAPGLERFEVDVERSQLLTKPAEDDDDGNPYDDLQWAALESGKALVYETPAFTEDLLLAGSGAVSLAIRADADDADLQVTITEVRPDGNEMLIQSGWLRASHRELDPAETTAVLPWHSHLEASASPLPSSEFTQVDIEIFPSGHAVRAGSKIRLIVDSPGGNRNLWAFEVLPYDGTFIEVDTALSTLSLPFVAGLQLPEGLPPCGDTRSQPCRPWIAYSNEIIN